MWEAGWWFVEASGAVPQAVSRDPATKVLPKRRKRGARCRKAEGGVLDDMGLGATLLTGMAKEEMRCGTTVGFCDLQVRRTFHFPVR